jgi:beta-N-acetylhexosaminidase
MSSTPLALIIGVEGYELTADEAALLREANPLGLFLFRRNIDTREQVIRLCAEIRETLGRPDAPIFIDQEGGRVQRLNNGNFPNFRPMGAFGALARKDMALGKRALRMSTQAMGAIMADLTIDSGTTPVVDLARSTTHDVIGQRAFGDDPDFVVEMAREVIDGMLEVGVLPIVKHIPGYGRVTVDPHFDCPIVDAALDDLRGSDFKPFVALRDAPWAMVAHLIFTQIDAARAASVSPVLYRLIREEIGYDGVLITDCLSMEALKGTPGERVAAALEAGADIALLTQNGFAGSVEAAQAARPLTAKTIERITHGTRKRGSLRVDALALHAEVERIFRENGLA